MLFVCYNKCGTCRKAKAYLENKGYNFEQRDIKLDNPREDELKKWISKSNTNINKWFNTSGTLYKEMGLKDRLSLMTDDEKIKLLSSNGMLVKRPILVTDDEVLVGFKEEEYSKLRGE